MTTTKFTNAAIIIGVLLLLVLPACALQISVTDIDPLRGYNNDSIAITNLSGANFNETSYAYLEKGGTKVYTFGTVYLISPQQLACSFNLVGLTAGSWNVTVYDTTNSSNNASKRDGFTVLNPIPVLTDVNPKSGTNNHTAFPVTITGSKFLTNARVNVTNATASPTMFNADTVVVNPAGTEITCTLNLANKIGAWQISVNNTDGQSTPTSIPFTIYNPAPIITSVSPSTGIILDPNLGVTIYGSNVSGATVNYTQGTNYIPKRSTTWGIGTIYTNLDLTSVPVGYYNVTVSNTGALYNNTTSYSAFRVTYPGPPVVNTILPSRGNNTDNVNVQIVGSEFHGNATVNLTRSSYTNITGTVTSYDSTTINCTLPILGKTVGLWNVIVTNNDTQSSVPNIQFNITNPKPQIFSPIVPNTGSNSGSPVTVQITGAGFLDTPTQPTVNLSKDGEVITGSNVVVTAGGTHIGCNFTLSGHTAQAYNVTVTNTVDGQSSDPLVSGFTITQPAPTVIHITPVNGTNDVNTSVRINGTGFNSPMVIMNMTSETNRTAVVVSSSDTAINCTLPTEGASVGPWTIYVKNNDGQYASNKPAFNVSGPGPVINSMDPAYGTNNMAVYISNLSGNNFVAGSFVTFTKTGQSPRTVSPDGYQGPNKISCFVDLNGAVVGQWNVTVYNPDGKSATLDSTKGFFVFYPDVPANIAITPGTGSNTTPINTAVTGTGFHSGLTANLTMGSHNIPGNVSNVTGIKFDSIFNLTGQTAGTYSLIVTNNDTQTGPSVSFIVTGASLVKPLPNGLMPTSPGHNGLYKDLNGNGYIDFEDVRLYLYYFEWIHDNEPIPAFDFNGNGRIDFGDVVTLFGEL